jgi:GNAT superfamily N-acetyltransferase
MELQTFDPNRIDHIAAATGIWNAACGPDLSFSDRFMTYNTAPGLWNREGRAQAGRMVAQDGRPVGFVLASVVLTDTSPSNPPTGHIDAIAVLPEARGRGIGRELVSWAEGWLRGQGCRLFVPGSSARTFVPGPPAELGSTGFFKHLGYAPNAGYDRCVDMAADLSGYVTPDTAKKAHGVAARPAQPKDVDALLGFLKREFPTGWYHECRELLHAGSRASDYVILESERGVDGCLLVTFEDSYRPLDRFYMHRLPHPWGQLGSVGISADCRGRGYGAVLMDGALRYLRDNGVRGCVIDWLVIVDFYARFGFKVYRSYDMLAKRDALTS